eukprot:76291_1
MGTSQTSEEQHPPSLPYKAHDQDINTAKRATLRKHAMGASQTFEEQQPASISYNAHDQQSNTVKTHTASMDTTDCLPPYGSLQMSFTNSTNSTISNSSTYSFTPSKKLLYTLDPPNLARIVKHILENEVLFVKYKHQSDDIYHAFINFGIKGKMIRKLTSFEFADELPWIRRVITSRLHVWLKTLSDDQVLSILNNNPDDPYTPHTPNGRLPLYLRQRLSMSSNCGLSNSNSIIKFNPDDEHVQDLCELSMYDDANVFEVFVYLLCVKDDEISTTNADCLVHAIIDIGMNGKEFMTMKRMEFCRALKTYGIKAGTAAKLYKLILKNSDKVSQYLEANNMAFMLMNNDEICSDNKTLNAVEIAEIAVRDFTTNAHKILDAMDRKMSVNLVNGLTLSQYYESKESLQAYIVSSIGHKSTHILVDILWSNYERDQAKEMMRMERYDMPDLIKYFTLLYMHQLQSVIIKEDLNEDKLMQMKRKEVCQILIDGCGFSIGVTTNIVNTIYQNIGHKCASY